MTVIELDARARKMREATNSAFDNLFEAIKQANLLLVPTAEEVAAYNAKHFGPDCKITWSLPPADPKDTAWKERHTIADDIEEPDL